MRSVSGLQNGKQVMIALDRILQWVIRLAYVNILWFIFTLMGGVVVGVFPATAAVLAISRKWVSGEKDVKIWLAFTQYFRKEFKQANLLGWILASGGAVLYFNYHIMSQNVTELHYVIPFAFYFVLFFYGLLVLWCFPLLVHCEGEWRQYIRNAVIIGLSKIHYSFGIGVVIIGTIILSLEFPATILFFSISLSALATMWLAMPILSVPGTRTTPNIQNISGARHPDNSEYLQ